MVALTTPDVRAYHATLSLHLASRIRTLLTNTTTPIPPVPLPTGLLRPSLLDNPLSSPGASGASGTSSRKPSGSTPTLDTDSKAASQRGNPSPSTPPEMTARPTRVATFPDIDVAIDDNLDLDRDTPEQDADGDGDAQTDEARWEPLDSVVQRRKDEFTAAWESDGHRVYKSISPMFQLKPVPGSRLDTTGSESRVSPPVELKRTKRMTWSGGLASATIQLQKLQFPHGSQDEDVPVSSLGVDVNPPTASEGGGGNAAVPKADYAGMIMSDILTEKLKEVESAREKERQIAIEARRRRKNAMVAVWLNSVGFATAGMAIVRLPEIQLRRSMLTSRTRRCLSSLPLRPRVSPRRLFSTSPRSPRQAPHQPNRLSGSPL